MKVILVSMNGNRYTNEQKIFVCYRIDLNKKMKIGFFFFFLQKRLQFHLKKTMIFKSILLPLQRWVFWMIIEFIRNLFFFSLEFKSTNVWSWTRWSIWNQTNCRYDLFEYYLLVYILIFRTYCTSHWNNHCNCIWSCKFLPPRVTLYTWQFDV
jgi:hypothetical protein